jgi:hypothetical protein
VRYVLEWNKIVRNLNTRITNWFDNYAVIAYTRYLYCCHIKQTLVHVVGNILQNNVSPWLSAESKT